MTYKEKFDNETDWRKKALIVELFHLMMLMKDADWTVRKTAAQFKKSLGLISENLNLAKAIKDGKLDDCDSRNKALKIIRKRES